MCVVIFCKPGCDVINFEINLIFLIKPFFLHAKKSRQKFNYLENEKSFKDEIKSIIFEGLSLKQIKKICWEGESPTLIIFMYIIYSAFKNLAQTFR